MLDEPIGTAPPGSSSSGSFAGSSLVFDPARSPPDLDSGHFGPCPHESGFQARTKNQVSHGEAAKNQVCQREALRRPGGLVRIGPRSGGLCGGVSALAIP